MNKKLKPLIFSMAFLAALVFSFTLITPDAMLKAAEATWKIDQHLSAVSLDEDANAYIDASGNVVAVRDKNNYIHMTVLFDLDSLPDADSKNYEYGIFCSTDPDGFLAFCEQEPCYFKGSALNKNNGVKVEFYVAPGTDKLAVGFKNLSADMGNGKFPEDLPTVGFVVNIIDSSSNNNSGNNGNDNNNNNNNNNQNNDEETTTKKWYVNEMLTDIKLEKDVFSLGSEQNVVIKFKNKLKLDEYHYDSDEIVNFLVISDDNTVINSIQCMSEDFNKGENTVKIPCRFPERGTYYVVITTGFSETPEFSPIEITVQKAKGSDGSTLDTKNYVSPQYLFYSTGQAKDFKIYYSVDDASSNYRLYMIKGATYTYAKDSKKILDGADMMSKLGEFPIELGKTLEVKVNTKFNDFGLYTIVLYNETTKKLVAEESFYVVPEKYLIQRDTSKMTDEGIIPFNSTAKVSNLDFDKKDSVKFKVEFPLNYKEYVEEFQLKYGKGSKYTDFYDASKYSDKESYGVAGYDYDAEYGSEDSGFSKIDNEFFKDDYTAYMTVKYVPEGSKESRILYRDKLKGMYKAHSIEITPKDLMEKIYETRGLDDIAYAGVVTVEFSNEKGALGFETIANDAILRFTESFSFGVYKSTGIKSASADDKSTERAYGEKAKFSVTDKLGGKIYADIYSGKKKVATAVGKFQINKNGTATGTVAWDLKNSSGKYCSVGTYTAKIYAYNEYYVFDKNGKKSTKKVKSKVKSVSFKLVKPNRKLTLKGKAQGSTGDSFVYLETPVIYVGVDVNIGSLVTINIKNPGGKTIKTTKGEIAKGSGSAVFDLGTGLKVGKYKAEIKAETLDKDKKSTTVSFDVKKMPKPAINNASVSVNDSGLGNVSFKVTQSSTVTVKVKSGSTVKQTVINQNYSAGTIKASFTTGGYAAGNYTVEISAKNSGGTATVSKTFTIKKKPAATTKPTVSSLNIRFLSGGSKGDQYQGSFYFTGKNSTVVIDILYDDLEEIVYTYTATTKNESGTYTYTWDGYKSNGFRAWSGNYTMRVYLVNSAGASEFLRRSFVIGEG